MFMPQSVTAAMCGNVIYVDPNEKVVAAVSSFFRPAVRDRIDFIENVLLPVIQKQ